MKITAQKIIPSKIELYNDEADIIVDFKLLCERIKRGMEETRTEQITAATIDGNITITIIGIDSMIELADRLFKVVHILPEV